MAAKIPEGLNESHFAEFEKKLKAFLKDFPTRAGRVTSRLNRSDKNTASPVWMGAVESQKIIKLRIQKKDPTYLGAARFKHENRSNVYKETLTDPSGGIVWRDWTQSGSEKPPQNTQANGYGPKGGCRWQAFIAIRIPKGNRHQHVGTLTAGFDTNLSATDKGRVENVMKKWAQSSASTIVRYLRAPNRFKLGGPQY